MSLKINILSIPPTHCKGIPWSGHQGCVCWRDWVYDHRHNQASQQKPGIEVQLSRKDLWRSLMSNDVDLLDFHED